MSLEASLKKLFNSVNFYYENCTDESGGLLTPCAIDLDSLLLYILEDKTLQQGQLLSAFHLLEKFLASFVKESRPARIVIFESFQSLATSSFYQLFRSTALLHLSQIASSILHVDRYESPVDPKWREMLTSNPPQFLLLHAPTKSAYHRPSDFQIALSSLAFTTLQQGTSIVLIDELTFKNDLVISHRGSGRYSGENVQELTQQIEQFYSSLPKPASSSCSTSEIKQKLSGAGIDCSKLATRTLLTVSSIASLLQQHKGDEKVVSNSQVFLLHSLLLESLSLSERAVAVNKIEDLSRFYEALGKEVSQLPQSEFDKSILDLVDTRLFSALVSILPTSKTCGLSSSQCQVFAAIWSFLSGESKDQMKIGKQTFWKAGDAEKPAAPLFPTESTVSLRKLPRLEGEIPSLLCSDVDKLLSEVQLLEGDSSSFSSAATATTSSSVAAKAEEEEEVLDSWEDVDVEETKEDTAVSSSSTVSNASPSEQMVSSLTINTTPASSYKPDPRLRKAEWSTEVLLSEEASSSGMEETVIVPGFEEFKKGASFVNVEEKWRQVKNRVGRARDWLNRIKEELMKRKNRAVREQQSQQSNLGKKGEDRQEWPLSAFLESPQDPFVQQLLGKCIDRNIQDVLKNRKLIEEWLNVGAEYVKARGVNVNEKVGEKFWKNMSSSLQGRNLLVLRDIVVTGKDASEEGEEKTEEKDPKEKEKKKKEVVKKKDLIIAQNQAKKGDDKSNEVERKVAFVESQKSASLQQKIDYLDFALLSWQHKESALIGLRVLLKWRIQLWQELSKAAKKEVESESFKASGLPEAGSSGGLALEAAARLFQLCHDLLRRFLHLLKPDDVALIVRGLLSLGLKKHAQQVAFYFAQKQADEKDKDKKKKDKKKKDESDDELTPSSALKKYIKKRDEREILLDYGFEDLSVSRFQLLLAGHLMLRNVLSSPDPRVTGFYPDAWQRGLLDCVDKGESALLLAPTSAGKSFISFYAISKIHQLNMANKQQRSTVVFVAPTKALVNQISAEVYLRTGEEPNIFTQDHRPAHANAEVLVTVPSSLEILLLSPHNQQFVRSIKYVVLDEVHKMNEGNEGQIWERIFKLLPCPFIANSATLGKAEEFHSWLQSLRKEPVRMFGVGQNSSPIIRWSHLDHYFFLPQHKQQSSTKLELPPPVQEQVKNTFFLPIHPVSAVQSVMADGDLSLSRVNIEPSSANMLQLFDVLVEATEKCKLKEVDRALYDELRSLKPESAFSDEKQAAENFEYITKLDTVGYWNKLKAHVDKWASHSSPAVRKALYETFDENFGKTLKLAKRISSLAPEEESEIELSKELTKQHNEEQDEKKALETASVGIDEGYYETTKNFTSLLLSLKFKDMLPALVFCMNRSKCEQLAILTTNWLKEQQDKFLQHEEKRVEQTIIANKPNIIAVEREIARVQKLLEKKESDELLRELQQLQDRKYDLENPMRRPLDRRLLLVTESERAKAESYPYFMERVEKRLKRLEESGQKRLRPLVEALKQGIGVHHAGLPKFYRDCVEAGFREGALKCVIATSTLALGINAPARTAVILDNSSAYSPSEYRQMAGRAGRRGYDTQGKVIFFGLPPMRALKLMCAPAGPIRSQIPLDASLLLRLSVFSSALSKQNYFKKERLEVISRLLSKSLVAHTSPQQEAVSFALSQAARALFLYLQRKGLIDEQGHPQGLAGFVCRLFASQPTNFVLASLLSSSTIRELCSTFHQDEKQTCERVVAVFAHFINPIPLVPGKEHASSSESSIVLPSLQELCPSAAEVIAAHDSEVLSAFVDCYKALMVAMKSKQMGILSQTTKLPFSGLDFSSTSQNSSVLLRSPFAALSIPNDEFGSVSELANTANSCLYLPSEILPSFNFQGRRATAPALNAYALDFYRHGKLDLIETQNGIRAGRVWHLLEEFNVVFKKMASCFEAILDDPQDPVFCTFNAISSHFSFHMANVEDLA